MIRFYFFLILSGLSLPSYAQKVDLDRYSFTAVYLDLPRMGLDTSYRTFSIHSDYSQGVAFSIKDRQLPDMVNIPGWRKLPGHAHIVIRTRMEDVNILNSEVRERIQILKDKNGKETGKRSYYYTEVTYSFAAEMKVNDFRGENILSNAMASRELKRTYKTPEVGSYNEAVYFFINNVFSVTAAITNLEVDRSVNELNNMLRINFGYTQRSVSDFLWILDSKKHPEYRAHLQAFNAFKQAMFRMRADQPLDEVEMMLKPVISYFERMKKRYNSDSKADRKMRYASYYNLAKIYYYLDQPDASMNEAGELMINDYDEKDGRGLEAAAADLKLLLDINKTHTRHFMLDTERFEGPGIVDSGY